MKSSEVEFAYPVFGFTTDAGMWSFDDKDELSTCGKDTLRDHTQDGMELIDSKGRRWKIVSMQRIGGVGLSLGLNCFLAGVSRIDHELQPLEPVTVDDVKRRVSDCLKADPDLWVWEDETLEGRLAQVDAVGSIRELAEHLGLDHFRAY